VREPAPSRRCFSCCWHSMNGFQGCHWKLEIIWQKTAQGRTTKVMLVPRGAQACSLERRTFTRAAEKMKTVSRISNLPQCPLSSAAATLNIDRRLLGLLLTLCLAFPPPTRAMELTQPTAQAFERYMCA
jgi:hypothetical protein